MSWTQTLPRQPTPQQVVVTEGSIPARLWSPPLTTKPSVGSCAHLVIRYGATLFAKGIVDAAKVTRSALQNAASVAAMVLTTETLITDLPEKKQAVPAGGGGYGGGHGLLGQHPPADGASPGACSLETVPL
jgi:hypothetical protein